MLVSSEILFYGLTLISISLSFLVIALVILFVRSIASYHKLKEEKDKLQANAVQLSQQILEEAQSKSEKIIVEARTKAAEILKTATIFTKDERENLNAGFAKATLGYIEEYRNILEGTKAQTLQILNNVSKDVKDQAGAGVSEMRQAITAEIEKAQVSLTQTFRLSFEKIDKELALYKDAKIKRINESVFEILKKATQNILGKSLNMSEHEDLILNSLEEAKKKVIER